MHQDLLIKIDNILSFAFYAGKPLWKMHAVGNGLTKWYNAVECIDHTEV